MTAEQALSDIDEALSAQPTEMDRLTLGPDAAVAAARETPAPAPPQPRTPRAPRRHIGDHEKGVKEDLKAMPAALRKGALAVTALGLARTLDAGGMTARDEAGVARELRQHMVTLAEMAPGERTGDETDEVRARRERRMLADAAAN